ncbi:MAG TPA: LLM class flavin-dependent oxidoreductase [Beijerinckiaceae bacterium]|jgi:luciferase family oxidoreductase group 1|nr:LLM class flavin-dependent oxidoreductase [Beijerinckiaceae bacterium]
MSSPTPLSALDLSFVTTQTPPSKALAQTIELAKHLDGLGYKRLWLAEHHSLASIASSAPEIMIGQVAAVTQNIRVGSGGVMLTNHAPLMVAERFKLLEALFPGRIDLGLGRAPGTDQVTAFALRRKMEERQGDDFLERLQELMLWESGEFPEGHPFNKVFAMPTDAPLPPIWLLGSSDYSAQLAAQIGVGYSFASHFSDFDAVAPMRAYREMFRPSETLDKPYSIIALAAVVAETDEEADHLAKTYDLNWIRRARGEMKPLASPEEADAHPWTEAERAYVARKRVRLFAGSPRTVVTRLRRFVEETEADEVMVTSSVFDHGKRMRSYELLMREWAATAGAPATLEA